MSALAAPPTWLPRRAGNGDLKEGLAARAGHATGRNGASKEGLAAGPVHSTGRNGASKEAYDRVGGYEPAMARAVASMGATDNAVRRSARTLHAACAELLAGYAAASREPWRQALLTTGCLDPNPRRPAARRTAPPLIVEDVVQPSDVLCALWLARRCGLFSPGSPCGDGIGLRSACEIVPSFAPSLAQERRSEVLEALRANAAWRAHRLARRVA